MNLSSNLFMFNNSQAFNAQQPSASYQNTDDAFEIQQSIWNQINNDPFYNFLNFASFNQSLAAKPLETKPIPKSLTCSNIGSGLEMNNFNKYYKPNTKTKLFVGNLPTGTSLVELIHLFGRYGKINEQLSVVKEDNYAFVHFYNDSDAENALNGLNETLFKNRYIRVQYSVSHKHIKKSTSKFFF